MFEAARPFGLVGLFGRPKATPRRQIKMRPWRLISMNSKIRMLPKLTVWTQVILICTIWPKEFISRICTFIHISNYCMVECFSILNRAKKSPTTRPTTQWFHRIGLFVVQAISLGPCRRPVEFLTSLHHCGRLSKIPNFQIHKVEKQKNLSPFRRKDFFVIYHERAQR